MSYNVFKITREEVGNILRWAVFIVASGTLAIKIAEVSAMETVKLIMANPEIAQTSILVNYGYLPF